VLRQQNGLKDKAAHPPFRTINTEVNIIHNQGKGSP
jgi:hypothetical protein